MSKLASIKFFLIRLGFNLQNTIGSAMIILSNILKKESNNNILLINMAILTCPIIITIFGLCWAQIGLLITKKEEKADVLGFIKFLNKWVMVLSFGYFIIYIFGLLASSVSFYLKNLYPDINSNQVITIEILILFGFLMFLKENHQNKIIKILSILLVITLTTTIILLFTSLVYQNINPFIINDGLDFTYKFDFLVYFKLLLKMIFANIGYSTSNLLVTKDRDNLKKLYIVAPIVVNFIYLIVINSYLLIFRNSNLPVEIATLLNYIPYNNYIAILINSLVFGIPLLSSLNVVSLLINSFVKDILKYGNKNKKEIELTMNKNNVTEVELGLLKISDTNKPKILNENQQKEKLPNSFNAIKLLFVFIFLAINYLFIQFDVDLLISLTIAIYFFVESLCFTGLFYYLKNNVIDIKNKIIGNFTMSLAIFFAGFITCLTLFITFYYDNRLLNELSTSINSTFTTEVFEITN